MEEFTTCPEDRPLVAQMAANDPIEAAKCAEVFARFVDGFDINCGCPQKWIYDEGLGAILSSKPELIQEIVREVRKRTHGTVSIKIRLCRDLQTSVEVLRRAEAMGIEWITVHGRTRTEATQPPVRTDAIALLNSVARVSVIFNGDITTPDDMRNAVRETGVDGVLCARGALANPAIFSGVEAVPQECLTDYDVLSKRYGGLFAMHQHHLAYMQYGTTNKTDRAHFTRLKSTPGLSDFLETKGCGSDDAVCDDIVARWAPLYSPSECRRDFRTNPTPVNDISRYTHIDELEDVTYEKTNELLSTKKLRL
jgi:tRNA-dihydrouridine synthase 4